MSFQKVNWVCRKSFHRQIMSYHTVFVYGTLKKGEPNCELLTKTGNNYAKFISKAKTVKKYPLVIASKYNVPFLLHKPGTGNNIIGEVYEVDDYVLTTLDALEDHPNFYIREVEKVELLENESGKVIDSWIYFLKQFKPSLLSEEYLTEYHSAGSHGKPYTESATEVSLSDVL